MENKTNKHVKPTTGVLHLMCVNWLFLNDLRLLHPNPTPLVNSKPIRVFFAQMKKTIMDKLWTFGYCIIYTVIMEACITGTLRACLKRMGAWKITLDSQLRKRKRTRKYQSFGQSNTSNISQPPSEFQEQNQKRIQESGVGVQHNHHHHQQKLASIYNLQSESGRAFIELVYSRFRVAYNGPENLKSHMNICSVLQQDQDEVIAEKAEEAEQSMLTSTPNAERKKMWMDDWMSDEYFNFY